MDQGILKRNLLSLKTTEEKVMSKQTFRAMTIYKHYILGFDSAQSLCDCTFFNTQNGTSYKTITSLDLGNRTGYSLCYWKDDILVFFGGSIPKHMGFSVSGPIQSGSENVRGVQFLQLSEVNAKLSVKAQYFGGNDEELCNSHHTAQIYKDCMYILGGISSSDPHALEIWKFDLNQNTWSKCQVNGEAPKPRRNLASALLGNKIYLFGGLAEQPPQTSDFPKHENDLFALDLETMTWEQIYKDNFLPITQYNDLQADVIDQKIYLTSPNFDEFFIYDPSTQSLGCSEGVSPKDGFMIKSYQDNAMIFRIDKDSIQFQKLRSQSVDMLSQDNHMELLWEEKPFPDVTFVVQNEEIPAHRIILLKSHHFRNLLKNHPNEAKIEIPDVSPANFKAILECIYLGKIVLKEQQALDLIVLADKYAIPQLKAECETCLSTNLNAGNLLERIQVAEAVKSEKLEDNIANFVATNLLKLYGEMNINLLPQPLLAKAMMKTLQNK